MRSFNDIMKSRIRWQSIILIIFFCYLAGRLYWVQIKLHENLYAEARAKYITSKEVKGTRGQVFDKLGNLLIGNMPCQDVSITPCNIKVENDSKTARIIAKTLGLEYQEVLKKVSNKTRQVKQNDGSIKTSPRQYAQIARNVPLIKARKLKTVLQEHLLARDVHFHDTFIRYYPKGELLSNVLGITTMSHDKIQAVMGVEKVFNSRLKSDSGKITYERRRDGKRLGGDPIQEERSHDGYNLYLTIIEPLQSILEEELDKACEKWNPQAVYAIMADPATGNVLAMAQRPSFNPNERTSQDQSVYRIRVIGDVFEPGSIMKPLCVAGALDYGVVTPATKIDCEQRTWFFRGKALTDTHAYGMQDVTGVIRKSSNIGTAKIAIAMGEHKLYRTLRKFGLGSRCGLPLRPEERGSLKTPDRWDGLSISRFGIGYGVSITPVQMLRAYCALANRGKLPKLRLLDRIENQETGEIIPNPIEPPQNIYASPATGENIVKMMITVTEQGGTATKAAIPGYHVAGKTGTARKYERGGYSTSKYYASFVGFVPAEKPAFVLLLTFDTPRGSIYGGTVAGPTWKAIAERTLKYMNIPPNVPMPEKAKPAR